MVALRGEKLTFTRVQEYQIVSDSDSCDSSDSSDTSDTSDSSDSSNSSDSSDSGNSSKWFKKNNKKIKIELNICDEKNFVMNTIL